MSNISDAYRWEKHFHLILIILIAIIIFPLLGVTLPPLVDFPNHLSRLFIIGNYKTDADLRQLYELDWGFRTYVLTSAIFGWLANFLPIFVVGKLYLITAMLSLVGSVFWLSKVLNGRVTPWALGSVLFVYNYAFSWGFIDYSIGLGVAIFILGVWIKWRTRPDWQRVALISFLVLVLYLIHLFALAMCGLMLFGYQIYDFRANCDFSIKNILRQILPLVIPFVLPFVLVITGGLVGGLVGVTDYDGFIRAKLNVLFSPTLMHEQVLISLLIWGGCIGILYYCLRSRFIKLQAPLISCILLISLLSIVVPKTVMGIWGMDFRMPVAAVMLILVSIKTERIAPRTGLAIAVVAFSLLLLRVGGTTYTWRQNDLDVGELRAAASVIDRGANLLIVSNELRHHYLNLPSLLVIERSVFIPNMFTGITVLRASPKTADIDANSRQLESYQPISPANLFDAPTVKTTIKNEGLEQSNRRYWSDWRNRFDYLLWIDFGDRKQKIPPALKSVHDGSFFRIFKIQK